MKTPAKRGSPNDFQTPPFALDPLLPYLRQDWTIWECACGKGNLVKRFGELGFKVIGSDILTGHDFLTKPPPIKVDCIVTNPPYSLKQQFLQRCYNLGLPFALLLPLTTFETGKRQDLLRKYGVEVILFDKRINFETPTGEGEGSWFATAWFTNWLNIGKELNYYKLRPRISSEQYAFDNVKEEEG